MIKRVMHVFLLFETKTDFYFFNKQVDFIVIVITCMLGTLFSLCMKTYKYKTFLDYDNQVFS